MTNIIFVGGSFLDVIKVRMTLVLSVLLYTLLLPYVFEDISNKFAAVRGYWYYYDAAFFDIILYKTIAIFPSFFLPWRGRIPSSVVLWLVYFLHIIPTIVLFPHVINVPLADGIIWTTIISSLFTLTFILLKYLKFNPPVINISYRVLSGTLILTAALSIFLIIHHFGIKYELPSVEEVYGVRSTYKETLRESGSILTGYIAIIGGFAISPLLINFAILFRKRYLNRSLLMFFLAFILSFTIYASAGFKSVAFGWALSLFAYFVLRKVRNFGYALAIIIPFFILINLLIAKYCGIEIIYYHWIRRVFITPGMNTNYFYDYISSSGIDHLDNAPLVISQIYYGLSGSANAGLIGDGLARYGYIGLFFNMGLFTIMLKICDAVSMRGNAALSSAVFMLSAYAISNSSLTTVLLTYGYLTAVLFLFFAQSSIEQLSVSE
jgi:hypothetical protein